jgi:hypothetical protein
LNSAFKDSIEYLGFFVKGVMIDVLDPEENFELVEKLDDYQRKMKQEFNNNVKDSGNRNIATILGSTLNSMYNRKLHTPETRGFLGNGREGASFMSDANKNRDKSEGVGFRILKNLNN